MITPYIKEQLKGLNKILRQYKTRQEKIAALETFEDGLRSSLWMVYDDKFPLYITIRHPSNQYNYPRSFGSMGKDFGPLEVQDAAETLFAEIEKRKARLAKPGMLERFTLFLKKADELVLISQNLRRYNHQKIL